ncbi:MAG: response regulator transcription factor [Chitinophagaceae bacterium]|nr:response regulator transcription factor [Chitinophagaceae bacterium]
MYKAIIVDDEAKARRLMEVLILENCAEIEIVGFAENVPDAAKLIHKKQPDLVFLDVDMPQYNGFELFNFVDKTEFEVIFCTAYSEFALKAFEVSAVDYLLKPIQISLLIKAVEKAIKLKNSNMQLSERISTLQQNIANNELKRIALPVSDGWLFINIDTLLNLEAEGSYTKIFINDGSKLLISKKLKEFETIFEHNPNFFRTHRSHIVNLNAIKQYAKQDGGIIILSNNANIPIARERKEDFQERIASMKL